MQNKDDQHKVSNADLKGSTQEIISQDSAINKVKRKRSSSSYKLFMEKMGTNPTHMSEPELIDFVDAGVHISRDAELVSTPKMRSKINRLNTHTAVQPQQEVQFATGDQSCGYESEANNGPML